jgi:NAD(P)H-flavin reductase
VLADHPDLGPFTIYAAGPPRMVAAIARDFPGHGALRLNLDSFDYATTP